MSIIFDILLRNLNMNVIKGKQTLPLASLQASVRASLMKGEDMQGFTAPSSSPKEADAPHSAHS